MKTHVSQFTRERSFVPINLGFYCSCEVKPECVGCPLWVQVTSPFDEHVSFRCTSQRNRLAVRDNTVWNIIFQMHARVAFPMHHGLIMLLSVRVYINRVTSFSKVRIGKCQEFRTYTAKYKVTTMYVRNSRKTLN